MQTLIVERADGIVTITLNRPEKKNAVSDQMWGELRDSFDEIADRRDDRVLVITGAGDAFCSGQDLSDDGNARRFQGTGGASAAMRRIGGIALRLHELSIPTIAAVNGVAAGAGCNLALGCDLVIASSAARFSQIFVRRGLTVDFGGTWLLPRLVGLHKAKELAFFGDIISADDAATIGIVNRVVPAEKFQEEVRVTANRLAAVAPLPVAVIKKALNDSFALSMPQALEQEAVAQAAMFSSQDAMEAMHAFIEKRDPKFVGD